MAIQSLLERKCTLVAGYFVSSVGVEEKVIKNYVERQGQMDSGQAPSGAVVRSSARTPALAGVSMQILTTFILLIPFGGSPLSLKRPCPRPLAILAPTGREFR